MTTDTNPVNLKNPFIGLKSLSDENGSGSSAAGMFLVMTAMLENFNAITNNESNGILPLGEMTNNLNLYFSDYWVGIMQSAADGIQGIIKAGGDSMSSQVNAAVVDFNLDSTESTQSSSFFGGLTSSIQQTGSDTAQTSALVDQIILQGPISQIQNVTRGF